MELRRATEEELKAIYNLYLDSFPEEERKDFALIKKKQEENKVEILSIIYNGEFAGMVVTLLYKDLVLIDYLAIKPEKQRMGIGSKTLSEIKSRYNGNKILLEIEAIDENAKNNADRIKRREFYIRNGLKSNKILVNLNGVEMETLTFDKYVPFDEYYTIYQNTFDDRICKLVSFIEKSI